MAQDMQSLESAHSTTLSLEYKTVQMAPLHATNTEVYQPMTSAELEAALDSMVNTESAKWNTLRQDDLRDQNC